MTDPLSITVGCFSLLGSIGKLAISIAEFMVLATTAREDLRIIATDLEGLESILLVIHGLLKRTTSTANQTTILGLLPDQLSRCKGTIQRIFDLVQKYGNGNKSWNATRWAIYGHEEMASARADLERQKVLLGVAMDVLNATTAAAIHNNTGQILESQGMAIESLAVLHLKIDNLCRTMPDPRINQWLRNVETVAGSVYSGSVMGQDDRMEEVFGRSERGRQKTIHEEPAIGENVLPDGRHSGVRHRNTSPYVESPSMNTTPSTNTSPSMNSTPSTNTSPSMNASPSIKMPLPTNPPPPIIDTSKPLIDRSQPLIDRSPSIDPFSPEIAATTSQRTGDDVPKKTIKFELRKLDYYPPADCEVEPEYVQFTNDYLKRSVHSRMVRNKLTIINGAKARRKLSSKDAQEMDLKLLSVLRMFETTAKDISIQVLQGANINHCCGERSDDRFLWAALQSCKEYRTIASLVNLKQVLEYGANPDAPSLPNPYFPNHVNGRKYGELGPMAPFEVPPPNEMSPLIFAIHHNMVAEAILLMRAGASPHGQCKSRACYSKARGTRGCSGCTPLAVATCRTTKNPTILVSKLLENGHKPNINLCPHNPKSTRVFTHILKEYIGNATVGSLDIIQQFLNAGAVPPNVGIVNQFEVPPTRYAPDDKAALLTMFEMCGAPTGADGMLRALKLNKYEVILELANHYRHLVEMPGILHKLLNACVMGTITITEYDGAVTRFRGNGCDANQIVSCKFRVKRSSGYSEATTWVSANQMVEMIWIPDDNYFAQEDIKGDKRPSRRVLKRPLTRNVEDERLFGDVEARPKDGNGSLLSLWLKRKD